MKIVLWIVSVLVALFFLLIGGMKVLAPVADMAQQANGVPVGLLKFVGAMEVLGAFGLVLPAATRVLPVLTPLAACGLVIVTVGAAITHLLQGQPLGVISPAILAVVCTLIALARFGRYAVAPRGGAVATAAA